MSNLQDWYKEMKSNPNFMRVGGVFHDIVDGNILVRGYFRRQYLLILVIVGLCILYIGNRYTCEKDMREQRELIKEITDKRFELLSISADLTEKSRGSVIEDSVSVQIPDLEVSRIPPVVIYYKE